MSRKKNKDRTTAKRAKLTEEEFNKALDMALLGVARKAYRLAVTNHNERRRVVDLAQAERLAKTTDWAKGMLKKIFRYAPGNLN